MDNELKKIQLLLENIRLKAENDFEKINSESVSLKKEFNDKKQEVLDSFEQVIDEIDNINSKIDEYDIPSLILIVEELNNKIDSVQLKSGEKGEKGDKGDKGEKGEKGKDGRDGKDGADGIDGIDGSPDTPEIIVEKLNSVTEALDWKVLKKFDSLVNQDTLNNALRTLENQTRFLIQSNQNRTSSAVVTDGNYITGDGTTGSPISLAGISSDGVTILGDGVNTALSAVTQQSGKGIINGGAVWSGTGFTFDVSVINYYIDATTYQTAATQVTLSASDPSDPRFDLIVVDDSQVVSVITGTPSATPAVPEIDWNQVIVTQVLVAAGSTTPTISQDLIYNENAGSPTEWVTSQWNLGGTMLGSAVFNSGASPYNGTVCARATGVNNRRGMLFTRGTDINIQNFGFVNIPIRNDNAIATNKNLNIRFRNSGGTLIGNSVNLYNYGASRTIVGSWQLVIVPITAFGNITNVRSLGIVMAGGTTSSTVDFSVDYIFLSGGIPPQSNLGPIYLSATNTLYSSGAAYGATSVNDSIFFGKNAGFQASAANGSIFLGKNSGFQAINASNSVFIGPDSGNTAVDASQSVFIGTQAGVLGVSAAYALMIGYQAGYESSSSNSVFMGNQAGYQSGGAYSVFIGDQSGYDGTQAGESVFIGWRAGYQAADANKSVFIGHGAGSGDTVDNSAAYGSILIGPATSTGGFSNSIAIGFDVTNTATNQCMIGSYASIDTQINQLVVNGTGGIQVPVGTTAERIATQGMVRFNTDTSKFEGYDGTTWQNFY